MTGARRSRGRYGLACAVLAALALAGCRGQVSSRTPIHLNPNMDHQPAYRAQASSDFFADGATMRQPVAGTVARGELRLEDAVHTGRVGGEPVVGIPIAVTEATLVRGADRYGIYCGPCHGDRANGKGMLYQRAQIPVADLTDERMRTMPSGQLFETISNGLGLMTGYGYVLTVEDRWAIIAYLRQVQGQDPLGEPVAEAAATEAAASEGAAP